MWGYRWDSNSEINEDSWVSDHQHLSSSEIPCSSHWHLHLGIPQVTLLIHIIRQLNKYWLKTAKDNRNGIISTVHWTNNYYLFCQNLITSYLQCSKFVAKDSGVVTITTSNPVFVNKEEGTICIVDTCWGHSCGWWVHMGVSKHIFWIKCGFEKKQWVGNRGVAIGPAKMTKGFGQGQQKYHKQCALDWPSFWFCQNLIRIYVRLKHSLEQMFPIVT